MTEGTVRAVGHAGPRVAVSVFQVEREGSEKHHVKGPCTELLETRACRKVVQGLKC